MYSESQLQSFQGYGYIFPCLVFTNCKISYLLSVKLMFKNRRHLNFKWNYTENLPVTLKNRLIHLIFSLYRPENKKYTCILCHVLGHSCTNVASPCLEAKQIVVLDLILEQT